ncbi:MoaD/ThiS family protein [Halosolutus amylolyticus]|uniref:MoaD/ThiS family protein n=1 Tax=Halosolutus amylolyticus TaxID=2932267 RepID=A0ABD5PQB0_9EURY|nr:MoaD/ThiS family protein [Halosolutus amylolyticus]
MQVECVFFGPFREAVGEKTVQFGTDAETVGELLTDLETAYPSLDGRLVAPDGEGLVGETVVTRDKKNVTHLNGVETPIESESVIRLVPSVYGG